MATPSPSREEYVQHLSSKQLTKLATCRNIRITGKETKPQVAELLCKADVSGEYPLPAARVSQLDKPVLELLLLAAGLDSTGIKAELIAKVCGFLAGGHGDPDKPSTPLTLSEELFNQGIQERTKSASDVSPIHSNSNLELSKSDEDLLVQESEPHSSPLPHLPIQNPFSFPPGQTLEPLSVSPPSMRQEELSLYPHLSSQEPPSFMTADVPIQKPSSPPTKVPPTLSTRSSGRRPPPSPVSTQGPSLYPTVPTLEPSSTARPNATTPGRPSFPSQHRPTNGGATEAPHAPLTKSTERPSSSQYQQTEGRSALPSMPSQQSSPTPRMSTPQPSFHPPPSTQKLSNPPLQPRETTTRRPTQDDNRQVLLYANQSLSSQNDSLASKIQELQAENQRFRQSLNSLDERWQNEWSEEMRQQWSAMQENMDAMQRKSDETEKHHLTNLRNLEVEYNNMKVSSEQKYASLHKWYSALNTSYDALRTSYECMKEQEKLRTRGESGPDVRQHGATKGGYAFRPKETDAVEFSGRVGDDDYGHVSPKVGGDGLMSRRVRDDDPIPLSVRNRNPLHASVKDESPSSISHRGSPYSVGNPLQQTRPDSRASLSSRQTSHYGAGSAYNQIPTQQLPSPPTQAQLRAQSQPQAPQSRQPQTIPTLHSTPSQPPPTLPRQPTIPLGHPTSLGYLLGWLVLDSRISLILNTGTPVYPLTTVLDESTFRSTHSPTLSRRDLKDLLASLPSALRMIYPTSLTTRPHLPRGTRILAALPPKQSPSKGWNWLLVRWGGRGDDNDDSTANGFENGDYEWITDHELVLALAKTLTAGESEAKAAVKAFERVLWEEECVCRVLLRGAVLSPQVGRRMRTGVEDGVGEDVVAMAQERWPWLVPALEGEKGQALRRRVAEQLGLKIGVGVVALGLGLRVGDWVGDGGDGSGSGRGRGREWDVLG